MIRRNFPRRSAIAPTAHAPMLASLALVAVASLGLASCSDSADTDGTTTTLPTDATTGFDVAKSDGDAGKIDTSVPDVSGKACVVPTDCDDNNPCTDDLCISKKCQNLANAAQCNDGDKCTTSDQCKGGTCVGKQTCDVAADVDAGKTDTDTATTPDTDLPPIGPDLKAGDLVITEMMFNPYGAGLVSDDNGEWVEFYNTLEKSVDLGGALIKSPGDTKPFVIPGKTVVAAKSYILIGTSTDKTKNGGVTIAAAWGTQIKLTNVTDGIILESNGVEVDGVTYDQSKGWPNLNGVSLSLSPSSTDATANDNAAAWCGANSVTSTTDKATPGAANDECKADLDKDGVPDDTDNCPTLANPTQLDANKNGVGDACEGPVPTCGNNKVELDENEACDDGNKFSGDGCSAWCQVEKAIPAGALIISEIMTNPAKVADDVGEWIEIKNVSSSPVELNGLMVQTGTLKPIQSPIEGPTALVLQPGGFALLAASADPAVNGGLPKPTAVYAKVAFSSTAATVSIWSAGIQLDQVTYGTGWPIVVGKSMALEPTITTGEGNDIPAAWCKGQAIYGDGDFGSPGQANPACLGGDQDEDKDGIPDKADNCLAEKNADQLDADGDKVGDACDNCPGDANTDQLDSNGDGIGNACEPPGCGNGVVEKGELCDDGNLKSGDGCNAACGAETLPEPGQLVISEILPDPSTSTDANGEWVEIYNAGTTTVELAGLVIKSSNPASAVPSDKSYLLPPGAYAVLAKTADPLLNGGIEGAIVVAGLSLSNSTTTKVDVRLESAGKTIDSVLYNIAGFPKVTSGVAMQLDPGLLMADKNDLAAAWCLASTAFGKGDKGTPGKVNTACPKDTDTDGVFDNLDNCVLKANADQKDSDADKVGDVCDNCALDKNPDQLDSDKDGKGDVCQNKPVPVCGDNKVEAPEACDDGNKTDGDGCSSTCTKEGVAGEPAAGDLVITEVMVDPTTTEPGSEWFEVTNVSGKTFDLKGMVVQGKDATEKFTISTSVPCTPGQILVFANSTDKTKNGGVTADVVYSNSSYPLSNSSADGIELVWNGTSIDKVMFTWGGTTQGWPAKTSGSSLSLSASKTSAAANDSGASWCLGAAVWSGGVDKGTPGALNPECSAPAPGKPVFWPSFLPMFW
jgi:cysteine-rich repeat protein